MVDSRIVELQSLTSTPQRGRILLLGEPPKSMAELLGPRAESVQTAEITEVGKLNDASFDIVWSFAVSSPVTNCFLEVNRVLTLDGDFLLIVRRRINLGFPRACGINNLRNMLFLAGFTDLRIYGLSPSIDELRLVTPLKNNHLAASSLSLYQPSLRIAKFRKLAAYCLSLAGLSALWTPYVVFVAKKSSAPGGLRKSLVDLYGPKTEMALFTGTPGYFRKPTIQIMNLSGRILGYAKIAKTSQTVALVEHEAVVLNIASKLELGSALIPQVRYFGDIDGSSYKILLQTSWKEPLSSSDLVPGKAHADFLIRLFDKTRVSFCKGEGDWDREVSNRLDYFSAAITEDWRSLLKRAGAAIRVSIKEEKIPLGLAHRDFTPWNTFFAGGKLVVFDWELAREHWPPMVDAFHFVIQKGVLVDKEKPDKLMEKVLKDDHSEGKFVSLVALGLGIEKPFLLLLLGFYVWDMASSYLNNYLSCGKIEQDAQRLLSCWKAMLHQIISIQGW